jgi:hypothetical protein
MNRRHRSVALAAVMCFVAVSAGQEDLWAQDDGPDSRHDPASARTAQALLIGDANDIDWEWLMRGPQPDRKGAAVELGWSDFHYVFAAGVTFHPRGGGASWEHVASGCIRRSGGDGPFTLNANLPQGARIDYVRIYYWDSSTLDSWGFVQAFDGIGGFTNIATVMTSGFSGYGSQTSEYVGHIVDNAANSYSFLWNPITNDNLYLCGMRIAYRLPE